MIKFKRKKEKAAEDVEQRQNLKNTIKTTKYMLGFVWNGGKLFVFLKGAMALLNALFPLAWTLIPGRIVDELQQDRSIARLALYVGILTVTPFVSNLTNAFASWYLQIINLRLTLKYKAAFYDHAASMDYETLEKPDVQTMKERAQNTLWNALGVVDQLSNLVSAVIGIIAISSIIATFNPVILLVIVLIVYVNSIASKWANQKQFSIGKQMSKFHRYQWGLSWMLHGVHYGMETRLYNLKSFLINTIVEKEGESNKLQVKSSTSWAKANTVHSSTGLLQQAGLYAYLIYSVIYKGLTVGRMTIYMSAVNQFSGSLNRVMYSYRELTRDSLNVQEMMEFMQLPLRQLNTGNKTPVFDKDSIIEFRNVSFKYPGSERRALDNLNLTIRGGEKLCVVGANGSGKSTFTKLLMRLYWPEEGEILLNGVNINEYDYIKYQRLFAPVFQNFCLYYLSLGKNITLADELDETRLNRVAEQNDLTALLGKLPKGFDTSVYKYSDDEGFDPSGGEAQRIAIARAVYHDADIFLLDEPTAALDPVAEYEIYMNFNEMVTDKTAIFITHRLSAVQLADVVAVFENGGLVEYGTHRELCARGGIYADMFEKQAKFYIEGNTEAG